MLLLVDAKLAYPTFVGGGDLTGSGVTEERYELTDSRGEEVDPRGDWGAGVVVVVVVTLVFDDLLPAPV